MLRIPSIGLPLGSWLKHLLDHALKSRQSRRQVLSQMHAQGAAIAFSKHLKVSASLRHLYHTKGKLLSWNGKVKRIIARNLQKYAGVWTALVRLTCRVQESRAETEAGCGALSVANGGAGRLKLLLIGLVHGNVGEQGSIIAGRQ